MKPQGTEPASTCRRPNGGFGARERGRRASCRPRTAMERPPLGEGRTPAFRTHISPPVGQSSPALLLAVLLGEERSALLMAMNSSGLFIQPSSACWLQPQPAPPLGVTLPADNAPGRGTAPPAREAPGHLCRSHPAPPLAALLGASPASPRTG